MTLNGSVFDLGPRPPSGYRRISYTTLNGLSATRRNLVNLAFDATSRIALCRLTAGTVRGSACPLSRRRRDTGSAR
jgi:hypothetical protein